MRNVRGFRGRVNGDGFVDVVFGAPFYPTNGSKNGLAIVTYGNSGGGLDRLPRQARSSNSALTSLFGNSDSPPSFRLKALGRTWAGRGRVRLQCEAKPFGAPFDAAGLATRTALDTGTPNAGSGSAVDLSFPATGLAPSTLCHQRPRVTSDSPFFPRSGWLGMSRNGSTEGDLRTNWPSSDVEFTAAHPVREARIGSARPSPFRSQREVAFTLAAPSDFRLPVVDVSGRARARLDVGRAPHTDE